MAIRFVADNPGVWSLHCHVTWHLMMGMHVVFIDAPHKMPAPGNDIPICGEITPNHINSKLVGKGRPFDKGNSCEVDIGLYVALIIGWCLAVFLLLAFIVHRVMLRRRRVNGQKEVVGHISMMEMKT